MGNKQLHMQMNSNPMLKAGDLDQNRSVHSSTFYETIRRNNRVKKSISEANGKFVHKFVWNGPASQVFVIGKFNCEERKYEMAYDASCSSFVYDIVSFYFNRRRS